jgi:AsmA-like C-terminal region
VKLIIKATLLAIAALACVAGLGLLAINLYVQSPDIQIRLREAVSDSLGYPISVFRTSFDPWTGLHLQGVSIQGPSVDYPILKGQDLWIRCDLFALVRHKLIVREIFLSGAEIRIPTAAHVEPETEALPTSESPPQSKLPNESITPPNTVAEKGAPEKYSVKENPVPVNFDVEIRKLKIRDSTVYVVGANGEITAALSGIEGAIHSHKGEYEGRMRIATALIANSFNVDKISSPVRFAHGAVDLKSITGQVSGGEIRGSLHADLSDPDLPYRVRLQMTGVNVNEIAGRAGGILGRAHGTLQGNFQLAGCMKDPSLAKGNGNLEIQTGYLDQFPMLKEIGRWTQIDELERLDLQRAHSNFSVVGQDIKVNSLQLISKNCEVNLSGTVESAQKLDLNGRLTLSQFLTKKIPSELEDNFERSTDGEGSYLDFQVTGSVLKPQTDLFERIIGEKGKLLRKLFRLDRREKDQTPDGADRPTTSDTGRASDAISGTGH